MREPKFKPDGTRCNCPCHTHAGMMHIVPCCSMKLPADPNCIVCRGRGVVIVMAENTGDGHEVETWRPCVCFKPKDR